MNEQPMKWSEMSPEQRNALVAEKVMGWQWIPYNFYDAAPDSQLWLLPDGQSVTQLTPGEWTYYVDEPEVYPEGSVFPLLHKDNRYIPRWIPNYTTSMDAAWLVVKKMVDHPQLAIFANELFFAVGPLIPDDIPRHQFAVYRLAKLTPEIICLAALHACGVEIEA